MGDIIRQLRISNGWSQQQLADHAHVALNTIKNLESGFTPNPRIETVMRIFNAFGIELVIGKELPYERRLQ